MESQENAIRENQASFKTVSVDVEELLENFGERYAIAKNA